ncbi:MAG: mechanosensitive ion channel [Gammaproteobacteria bacterium]|nr:mechanosensitive ion channel [Gammaproteobacteria bacterium]
MNATSADAIALADKLLSVQTYTDWLLPLSLRVIGAIAILVIGRMVARMVTRGLRHWLEGRDVDPTVVRFGSSVAYVALMAMIIIAVLNQFGVQTASFVAMVGAAGLAVGLALQGALSNFAAGVLMVLLRPFKVGDYIEGGGASGSVEEIMMFSTRLVTPDNREVVVPNGALMNGIIINYSARDTRRVDMVFAVSYESDLAVARRVIESALQADDRILPSPTPLVAVHELADSSVNFVVRPWVKRTDYWRVYADLNEKLKINLEAAGVSLPYPQRQVHIVSNDAPN